MGSANTLQKCVALFLSALVPMAVMASDWSGTVTSSSGVVSLNGQPIRGSHTLMSGDSLRTANGKAIVHLANGTIAISDNSDARFDGSTVLLKNGFAQVSGSKDLHAQYRDISIHPVSAEQATFVVGELNGKPTVAALKGVVVVSNASGSVVLPAGRAIEAGTDEEIATPVAEGQEGQAAEPAVKGGHGPRGDQERGGKRNRRMLAGWWEAAIIAGLIGATLGGMALAGVFDSAPISTASPSGGRGTSSTH